jgi:RNA 3'-phosphate cyclase
LFLIRKKNYDIMTSPIEIDGSFGSGGGAILRVASALSAVTRQPIHVFNIRKDRPRPGLRIQHLEGLKAVSTLCSGSLEGAELGSEEISFHPGKIKSKTIDIKISTAGSSGLLFQSLKLPASFAEDDVVINISGGATFSKWAPPLLSSKNTLLPILEKMGYKARVEIEKHGFYPVGGSRISITVSPCKELKPLVLDKLGKITHLGGVSVASSHLKKARVAERQASAASAALKRFDPRIKETYVDSNCPGSGIVLWATDGNAVLGGDAIGERGRSAEDVGKEAAHSLLEAINPGAGVDSHISDQLLIFMAFANGRSRITTSRLTNHTKTNIWVIKKFLDVDFTAKDGVIECSGRK